MCKETDAADMIELENYEDEEAGDVLGRVVCRLDGIVQFVDVLMRRQKLEGWIASQCGGMGAVPLLHICYDLCLAVILAVIIHLFSYHLLSDLNLQTSYTHYQHLIFNTKHYSPPPTLSQTWLYPYSPTSPKTS